MSVRSVLCYFLAGLGTLEVGKERLLNVSFILESLLC
jgi:hypothetical protein